MRRSPYLIVKEFCDSESEQQRRSAATALATIADEESLGELVRMGLKEANAEIREYIEIEITQLPPPERSQVAEALVREVEGAGPDSRKAYRLLGELRSRGVDAPHPNLSIIGRLNIVRSLHSIVYPNRSIKARMRGASRSLAGATGAAIIVGLIQTAAIHQNGATLSDVYGFLFLSVLIAITVAALSMQFSSPIAMHADRPAIAFLDLLAITGASVLVSAVIVPIMASYDSRFRVDLAAGLMLPVLAIATRLTMLTTLGLFKNSVANFWTGVVWGASAGTLAMSFIPALCGVEDEIAISDLWFTLLPVAAGLAAAWAQQDATAPVNLRLPFAVRIAGALPALIVVAAAIMVGLPRGVPVAAAVAAPDNFAPVAVNSAAAVRGPFTIHASPAKIPFELAAPMQIRVSTTSESGASYWRTRPLASSAYIVAGKTAQFTPPLNAAAGSQSLTISCDSCDALPSTTVLKLVSTRLSSQRNAPAAPRVLGTVTLSFGPVPPAGGGKAKK